ncbi:hypothetical protein JOF55_000216 [Haloactinomyces albus]|uniref:Uncharacterized protein n=1 Tax=Haloactinomyces albus TaxID=1352928 RepID=A0AAE3Z9Z6_9ACTN|nr:hypothetical protein [Haloactinomyces albus]
MTGFWLPVAVVRDQNPERYVNNAGERVRRTTNDRIAGDGAR